MEQRRRRSFFGDDSGSGELPVLSPASRQKKTERSRLVKVLVGLLVVAAVAYGVYALLLGPGSSTRDDHQVLLDKLGKMTPEELAEHRANRLERHKQAMNKKNQKERDEMEEKKAKHREAEIERATAQRRQRKEKGRASGDGFGEDDNAAGQGRKKTAEMPHQPSGKYQDDKGKKEDSPASLPVRRTKRGQGQMPGSPKDLKNNNKPTGRGAGRRSDIEARKAAYDAEMEMKRASAVAKGKARAARLPKGGRGK